MIKKVTHNSILLEPERPVIVGNYWLNGMVFHGVLDFLGVEGE